MSATIKTEEHKKFRSFAVLDFETSNLPQDRFNKVGITELTIYGIAVSEFKDRTVTNGEQCVALVELPRVLHKLTLMINPMMAIDPSSEKVTHLDNFMLEAENKFDENAANVLLSFLRHLQQPVCLVAHNGFKFDFPILKYVLERINKSMPNDVYTLDSLRAFHDIDDLRQTSQLNQDLNEPSQSSPIRQNLNEDEENICAVEETSFKNKPENFNIRLQNETTPKRPIESNTNIAAKRSRTALKNENNGGDSESSPEKRMHSRRKLNFDEMTPKSSTNKNSDSKWFPPKDIYRLSNVFLTTFSRKMIGAHHAEADVKALTEIMLHYGPDFVSYAEKYAIPFSNIPHLGTQNNI